MPWPDYITLRFAKATPAGEYDESAFYGPYNMLLGYLFPATEGYMVSPQYTRPEQSKSGAFNASFLVHHHHRDKPVFFMEIKPSSHLRKPFLRRFADSQMRERAAGLVGDGLGLPVVYGVGAIGTSACVYKLGRETGSVVEPAAVRNAGGAQNARYWTVDTAPIEWWNLDLLGPEGEQRLRDVVAGVKAMCAEV